jgi:hypothetical protein
VLGCLTLGNHKFTNVESYYYIVAEVRGLRTINYRRIHVLEIQWTMRSVRFVWHVYVRFRFAHTCACSLVIDVRRHEIDYCSEKVRVSATCHCSVAVINIRLYSTLALVYLILSDTYSCG